MDIMGVLLLLPIITCPILPAIISDLMKIVKRYLEKQQICIRNTSVIVVNSDYFRLFDVSKWKLIL